MKSIDGHFMDFIILLSHFEKKMVEYRLAGIKKDVIGLVKKVGKRKKLNPIRKRTLFPRILCSILFH